MSNLAKIAGCWMALWAMPAVAEIDTTPYEAGFDACIEEAVGRTELLGCIGQPSRACQQTEDDGSSTIGMMFCALMERELWDAKLNVVYQEQVQFAADIDRKTMEYGQAEFANLEDSLRDAQRAWIPFRDAQCSLEYAQWGAGSMRQIAGATCHRNMTAERAIYLMTAGDAIRGE